MLFSNILLTAISASNNAFSSFEQLSIHPSISDQTSQARSRSRPTFFIATAWVLIHCVTTKLFLELSLTKHRFEKKTYLLIHRRLLGLERPSKSKGGGKESPPPMHTYDVFIAKYGTDQMLVTEWENVHVSYSIYAKKVDKSANAPQYLEINWQRRYFCY